MSRDLKTEPRRFTYEIPEELKPERAQYNPTPNIKGMSAAAARLIELFPAFAEDVSTYFIKRHVEITKKLGYYKIGGNRWFSDRDLFDLVHIGLRENDTTGTARRASA